MTGLDKSWMTIKDRLDPRYERGVNEFLDFAFHEDRRSLRHGDDGQLIPCPCKNCVNGLKYSRHEVKIHLICDGVWAQYINWVSHGEEPFGSRQDVDISVEIHGQEDQMSVDTTVQMLHELQDAHTTIRRNEEEPNAKAKEFYKLLNDAETPLYPGCQNISRITFLLKLLHIKTMNQVTGDCMGMFLDLLREILPEGANVPQTWYEAKKLVRDLGLSHVKIDACETDCVLFWKKNEDKDHCPQCQVHQLQQQLQEHHNKWMEEKDKLIEEQNRRLEETQNKWKEEKGKLMEKIAIERSRDRQKLEAMREQMASFMQQFSTQTALAPPSTTQ